MFATAIAWLVARGVPAGLARPLLIGGAVVALALALLLVARCAIDAAVDRRLAEMRGAAVERARGADAGSAETARQDDARNRAERDELERIVTDETDRPLTDSERGLLRCVRLQQSARAAGRPAPAC